MRTHSRALTRVVVSLSITAAAAAGAPLLQNADFSARDGATKLPTAWTIPEQLAAAWLVVDDDGHSGNDSLRYRADGALKGAPVTQEIACEPQTEYVLSAWLKAGPLGPVVRVPGKDDQGRDADLARLGAAEGEQWVGRSARFNSGPASRLRVEVFPATSGIRGDVPAGTCWVDDVQIVPAAEYSGEAGRAQGGYTGPVPGPNLARGKPYTLKPNPNYGYCTEEGDNTQLTDGEHSVGYFWVQKSTVGWNGAPYVDIAIDLGEVQPIAGCSYNTAAGVAGVAWPSLIFVLVSDDGNTWHSAGDLIAHAAVHGLPAPQKYATHRYVATDLKAKGRYFRLLVAPSGSYSFCDEIEVYPGPPELLAADLGQPVENVEETLLSARVVSGVRSRLLRDLEALREEAKAEGVPAATRQEAEAAADRLEQAIGGPLGPYDELWRAIHPLTPVHARLHAARAKIKRALGAAEFTVWEAEQWDMLEPTATPIPPPDGPPALRVAMMQNEYRAAALNLSNMGQTDLSADISLTGLPGAPKPDYLAVHQVEFIETQLGAVVADALPLAPETPTGWKIVVPAGMARQVWLNFRPDELAADTYRGEIAVAAPGQDPVGIPLELKLHPLRFPDQPTCSLGMWDYSGQSPNYDLGPGNVMPAVANMRAHFIDTPWGTSGDAPWPTGFDDDQELSEPLDFDRFDFWMDRWEGVRNYAIFLAFGKSRAGMTIGEPEFEARVASWLRAWMDHALERHSVEPGRFYFLLVDEPSKTPQEEIIIAWAKAIKAAVPEVNIWEDPVHRAPEKSERPEMFEVSDVLCPNLGIFANGSETSRQFYENLRQRGKTLWFYQCSGPVKTFDPYYYYRLQHWYCFRYGATGSGFWAYGDAARSGNSWNDLRAARSSYTPVYIDASSVTDGKHFEAVREGIEDYEYLVMLRARADDLEQKGRAAEARRLHDLLASLVDDVCGEGYDPGQVSWTADKDRTRADAARLKILEALAAKED